MTYSPTVITFHIAAVSSAAITAARSGSTGGSSDQNDVACSGSPIVANFDVELDQLAVVEGPKAVESDRGLVNEDIFGSFVVGCDEPEPFPSVEPFDCSS